MAKKRKGLLSPESIKRLRTDNGFVSQENPDTLFSVGQEKEDFDLSDKEPPFGGNGYARGEVHALWMEEGDTTYLENIGIVTGSASPKKEIDDAEHNDGEFSENEAERGSQEENQVVFLPPEYDESLTFTEGVSGLSLHRSNFLSYYEAARLDGLENKQVLELILQFAVPLRNTIPLAERLMERFGTLYGVFGAGVEQLLTVKGMTKETAILIDLIMQSARRAVDEQNRGTDLLNTDEKVGEFLVHKFFGLTNETIMLLCLDNTCRLISCTTLAEGSSSVSRVSVRKVFEIVLSANASNVILAHNHPGGVPFPSEEDVRTTETLAGLLQTLDVELVDHIIVAGEKWRSMAKMGHLSVRRVVTI